ELGAKPRTTGYRSAEVPHTRDLSKKYKLTAMAGFGAFGLVIFGILWLEIHARRISSIDEVAAGLSLRILGTLPIMPGWMARGKGTSNRTRQALFRSVWTESIDSARTILL